MSGFSTELPADHLILGVINSHPPKPQDLFPDVVVESLFGGLILGDADDHIINSQLVMTWAEAVAHCCK